MSDQIALPLFPIQDMVPSSAGWNERVRRIAWSYSRRGILEQCPLRYYYTYYGSNGRTAHNETQKAELYFLRKLQNRHERAGAILHSVIAASFRKARSGGAFSVDRLCAWARHLFNRDLDYSVNHPDRGQEPNTNYPPVLLREFHYRTPDAMKLCEETRDRLLQAVDVFGNSPVFYSFREAGLGSDALIEQRISVQGLACKVEGRIDLAYKAGHGVIIVDWKLGNRGSGDQSLQLVAYGLWACQRFLAQPTDIQVFEVRLATGEASQYNLNGKTLARGQGRILQDAERMAAMDDYGRAARAEAFTPCAQDSVCALCPFQKACPEGRAFLDA